MATGTSERFLTQFRQAWASEPQRPRLQAEIRRMTGADAARCLEVYVDASEASLRDATAAAKEAGRKYISIASQLLSGET